VAANAELGVSTRIRLAQLAEQVLGSTDAVTGTAGPMGRWVTDDGTRTIDGVTAAEDGMGQVEVELHLVALWPPEPFERLDQDLRRRMRRSASLAGIGDRLGALQISFDDVRALEGCVT